jgi:hypothetical protein
VNVLGRVAGSILVAGALSASMITSTASTLAATTVTVLQLNICHSGIAGCYTGDAVLARAVQVIGATRPKVLSVNEACAGDVGPLLAAMGPAATRFVAAEHPDGTPVACVNGQSFGNIVMVAAALAGGPGFGGRYTAQYAEDELRVWACLPAGALTACTTHLSSHDGATAFAECAELMSRAAAFAATGPVVVSGDLNLRQHGEPDAQNCDRTGFFRKGDGDVQHVFATTDLAFVSGTRISMSGTTDHPAWLVTLMLPER